MVILLLCICLCETIYMLHLLAEISLLSRELTGIKQESADIRINLLDPIIKTLEDRLVSISTFTVKDISDLTDLLKDTLNLTVIRKDMLSLTIKYKSNTEYLFTFNLEIKLLKQLKELIMNYSSWEQKYI